jgi:CHAT domain-containing protein
MKSIYFSVLLQLFILAANGVEAHGQGIQLGRCGSYAVFDTNEAIRKGEAKEVLSFLESRGLAAETNRDWVEAAFCYHEASKTAAVSGQLQTAIAQANKSFELAAKAQDKSFDSPYYQSLAALRLGLTYRQLGQYEKATEWIEKGIEIVKKIVPAEQKERLQASLYKELGMELLRRGETQKAVDYISYSFQILDSQLSFRKRNSRKFRPENIRLSLSWVVASIEPLGTAYRSAGNTDEMIKTYSYGLRLLKENELKTQLEGTFYLGLGQAYLEKKDFAHAHEHLNKALEIAERARDADSIQQASSEIGDLLRQTQKPSEAVAYYKKAIDSIESTRSLLQSEEFRSSFFDNKRQTYSGMILACLDDKNTECAFSYGERARSRAFLDILGSKVRLARGNLIDEERALQTRLAAVKAMIAGQDSGELETPQLRQELESTQKAYNEFLAKVSKENKEQASLMSVEPLTLKQVQGLLDPGVTMLEYFVTEQAVLLWAVEKDQVQFINIPLGRKELAAKVGALRESVAEQSDKDKYRALSQELYRLLLAPARQYIRGKELLIIPHDVLHYVPFQALIAPSGRYLIEDYALEYLSSASLMQFTKEKKHASRETVLALGNPNLGDEAFNLRFAEREAKEIAAVYTKSSILLREQATKAKAISLSPANDILHFAVHAEFNEDDPTSSALLLARDGNEDGKWKVSEIFSLNLKADLVVLSACETGLGKISNGDEIVGLTRAFIYAGTPSVITTLWKVNDRASFELMKEFYLQLKTQKKSAALRQAQLKTMKEFPEPFFWAAFGLTGEP